MTTLNIINLVDDDDEDDYNNYKNDEPRSILSRICEKEHLYDLVGQLDRGKSANVYRAKTKSKDENVVIRIIYSNTNTNSNSSRFFPLQITTNEWKEKNERFQLFNTFPDFFPRVYNWGIVSSQSVIINKEPQQPSSSVTYKAYYEILEYLPTDPIPNTRSALYSLYDFLYEFWKKGFTHGDLTLGNIRFYDKKWRLIDLDSVRYNNNLYNNLRYNPDDYANDSNSTTTFSFHTPYEFYYKGEKHRDHNNFTILIDSIPQWRKIVSLSSQYKSKKRKSKKNKKRKSMKKQTQSKSSK